MHEITIARRLLDRALEAAAEHDADRIESISVAVGEATHLNPRQLEFWLDEFATDTPADGMDLHVETIAARGECTCGWSGELSRLESAFGVAPDRRCPDCGTVTALTNGTECRLDSVTVPDDEESTTDHDTQRADLP